MKTIPIRVRSSGRGSAMAALIFFLLGAGVAIVWFETAGSSRAGRGGGLSRGAIAGLQQLNAPVQVRFYSVLPAESASPALQDFAARVDGVLSGIRDANPAEIEVVRINSPAETNADAAAAEGLRAFNIEKGRACFLGISLSSGDRKDTLPELDPEWEAALPDDLARAILRVGASAPAAPAPVAKPPLLTPALTNEIHQLIPDVASTSPEDADRIFREDFLKQCARAGAEMESNINVAAQAVVQAQKSGSASELEAAKKNLAKVQFEQTEKLKEVAAHLQLQVDAFAQMKAALAGPAK